MSPGFKNLFGAVVLVGTTALVTTHVVSQNEPPGHDAEMEAWMKLGEPGPQHAQLMKSAGKWTQEITHWMAPGAPPQKSTSTATGEALFGGRYLLEKSKGTFDMGQGPQTFEGLGIHGFDNATQKYFFAWIDNMSTMMMIGEGTADPSGKVITYMSEMPDPMSGGTQQCKSVCKWPSDDKHVFEMYTQQDDGTWFKQMELVATRAK